MRPQYLLLVLSISLHGCVATGPEQDADGSSETGSPDRGPLGKADKLSGTCVTTSTTFCGAMSTGLCWCDELCFDFGDCCHDVEACFSGDDAGTGTGEDGVDDSTSGDAEVSWTTLEYHFGNQIFGSELEIGSDGRVTGQERSCCPPTFEPGEHEHLAPEVQAQLDLAIASLWEHGHHVQANDGALGELYGELRVHASDGSSVLVRALTSTEAVKSDAPEADWIIELAHTYVEHDIPK